MLESIRLLERHGEYVKQLKKYLIFIILILFCTLSFIGCDTILQNSEKRSLEGYDDFLEDIFINEVQKDMLTLNYSLANPGSYGITSPNITLGHYSSDYIKEQLISSENYLAALKQYDYDSLSASQQLDYDILFYDLSLDLESGNYVLYNEILGPTTGIQAQLPVLLAEYNFYEKENIDTYLSLLPQVYAFFEEICIFEKQKSEAGLFMNDAVAEHIINQCESFISDKNNNYLINIFNDKLEAFDLTKKEKKTYEKQNQELIESQVIPAYELLISTLKDLKGTGVNPYGLSYYDKGKEYYEYLIKENTGSSKSITELKTILDQTINNNIITLSTLMTKDTKVYEDVVSLTYSLTDPVEIITYLKSAMLTDFPNIKNVNYSIKYVPKSLQDYLSPAMYLLPAIDHYEENVIYINQNPNYDLSQIFTTIAHEGYPGHLYQSVYFRDQKPASIRNLLDFSGYVEGWATYVEYYSYHLAGFRENVADFLEANMIANMALYCRLDIGINYDGWTQSETSTYLNDYGITDATTIGLLYTTMIEEPALYPQYGIGYLEIMELKNTAENALGNNFILKDFHEFFLDIGPAPFSIIKDQLEEWILSQ